MNGAPDYAFVDVAGGDLTRLLDGTAIDGALVTLTRVPAEAETLSGDAVGAGALGGPAAIAAAPDGAIYLTDPEHDRVLVIEPCAAESVALPCLELHAPRGLGLHPGRGWLLVADTGADRVVVVDTRTRSLRGPWPVSLDAPADLAVDAAGNVYVVEGTRVSRHDADGAPDSGFADRIGAGTPPAHPSHVAMTTDEGSERLLVLDHPAAGETRILVYALDGTFDAATTARWRAALAEASPTGSLGGIAAGSGGVFVTDPAGGRILAFAADGAYRGAARWHGTSAGLALDRDGRLVIHTGSGVVRLGAEGSGAGTFRIGPIAGGDRPVAWRRLQVRDAAVPEGAHVRLFTLTTDDAGVTPAPLPAGDGDAGPWRAAPADALDCFIGGDPSRYLWVGGRLQTGAGGAPAIGGLRVEHDGEGWLRHLPALYSREPSQGRDLLDRMLAALESSLDEEEWLIEDLPRVFDAATAPDDGWLDWLAGWLAFELEAGMTAALRRDAVASMFELEGLRGTADGLRRLIALLLGVDVEIIEPAARAAVWTLGGTQTPPAGPGRGQGLGLGLGTKLAAAEPDGAVLATTATLEASHLIDAADHGAPLYADLAHRFCVRAYAGDLAAPGAREALERIVERERPAHAIASVHVTEPRGRVGAQATVGVDAIVAAPAEPMVLGRAPAPGAPVRLDDADDPPRSALGAGTHLGRSTTVT